MSDTWTLQDEAVNPYLQICKLAARSPDYFNIFKSHPSYRHVLEHVSEDEGQKYLDEIKIDYMDKLDEIKQNDSLEVLLHSIMTKLVYIINNHNYIKNTSDIITKFEIF